MVDGVLVGGAGVRDLDGEVDDAVAVGRDMVGEEVAPLGGLGLMTEVKTNRAPPDSST